MKKLLVSALLLTFAFAAIACGGKNENVGSGTVNQIQDEADDAGDEDAKVSDGTITKEMLISHEETPAEDFVAWKDEDGNMEINQYTGDDEIVVIPGEIDGKPVVKIDTFVFANDCSVKAIKLSDSVKEIDEMAFSGNKNLQIVVAGSGLEVIGTAAFQQCDSLQDIELKDGLKIMRELAFSGCVALKSVYIPDSVEEIEGITFYAMSEGFVIQGKAGSAAETYAQSEDIKFEAQ